MHSFSIIISKSMQQKRSIEKNKDVLSMNNDIQRKIEESNTIISFSCLNSENFLHVISLDSLKSINKKECLIIIITLSFSSSVRILCSVSANYRAVQPVMNYLSVTTILPMFVLLSAYSSCTMLIFHILKMSRCRLLVNVLDVQRLFPSLNEHPIIMVFQFHSIMFIVIRVEIFVR